MEKERTLPGWTVGIGVVLLIIIFGYFALGMPGMDHSGDESEDMDMEMEGDAPY